MSGKAFDGIRPNCSKGKFMISLCAGPTSITFAVSIPTSNSCTLILSNTGKRNPSKACYAVHSIFISGISSKAFVLRTANS